MSTPADLSRPLPTAATEAREEKLVESKGVEPLPESTPGAGGAGQPGAAEGASSAPASAKSIARPQTLLEAAKALVATLEWSSHQTTADLRAAIAREEDSATSLRQRAERSESEAADQQEITRRTREALGCPEGQTTWAAAKAMRDRAQQAEADAKWHREESERLSVHLTRMIAERDHLQSRVDDTDGRIAAMEIHGNSADHWYRKATAYKDAFRVRDEAVKRAEKAEAELVHERSFKDSFKRDAGDVRKDLRDFNTRLAEVVPMSENPIDTARKVVAEVHTLREHLKKVEGELAGLKTHARKVGERLAEEGFTGLPSAEPKPFFGERPPAGGSRLMNEAELVNARFRAESAQANAETLKRVAAIDWNAPCTVRVRAIPGGWEIELGAR